jgi:pyridoxine 4-dehydrogenase
MPPGDLKLGGELTVRRLGLGAMRIMQAGPEGSRTLLRRAVELGVNLIDTADVYGQDGASERLIAEALHPYSPDLVIATKGGQIIADGKPQANGTRTYLRTACEASLARLRVNEIDLYQLHNADPAVPLDESLGALAELRDEGKIRHIGVCNLFGQRLERALAVVPVASVQNRYNLSDRSTESDLVYCEARGIAYMTYAPLGTGALATEPELEEIATAHGGSPAQIALAWLINRSSSTVPIPGTSSLKHLEENVAASCIRLSQEVMARLDSSC